MTEHELTWVPVASYGAGYEADMAIAILEASGIQAVRRGNDIVGLFGPSFEGYTARGVQVLVLSDMATEARELLEEPEDPT